MRNLILLFRKFGSLILFIFLEIIAFFLIVNYNNKQKEIFLYSSNIFTGTILERYAAGVDYFNLKDLNDSIALENAQLMERLFQDQKPEFLREEIHDSSLLQYEIIPAQITNKSINLRNNRITLDKGSVDGIKEGMGVLSTKGIIGVVQKVNSRFASVMPIINTQMQVSVRIRTKNYFGDLVWEPYDERYMLLKHIPKHAAIALKDTVVTSGYSTVFPRDIPIGTIENIRLPAGSNYFDIRVKLFNELANMDYVYVVGNRLKDLMDDIEKIK
jgi:rod shape-determining protein MreC